MTRPPCEDCPAIKPPRRKVDWAAVKDDYRTSDLSLHKLGEKHGVSHTQIRRRAAKESWPARNLAGTVQKLERVPERVAEPVPKRVEVFSVSGGRRKPWTMGPVIDVRDPRGTRGLAITAYVLSAAARAVSVTASAWYGFMLAPTREAGGVFCAIATVSDLGAAAMLPIAYGLFARRAILLGMLATIFWPVLVAISLLGAIGFAGS